MRARWARWALSRVRVAGGSASLVLEALPGRARIRVEDRAAISSGRKERLMSPSISKAPTGRLEAIGDSAEEFGRGDAQLFKGGLGAEVGQDREVHHLRDVVLLGGQRPRESRPYSWLKMPPVISSAVVRVSESGSSSCCRPSSIKSTIASTSAAITC